MNTKAINSAAGVINAALTQNRTASGIALALDSAGLLMTPETAAELASLRQRFAVSDHSADEDPIAFALTDKAEESTGGCPRNVIDGDVGGHFFKHGAFVDGPKRCIYCGTAQPEDDVRPQVRRLRPLLAGQREQTGGETR